MIVMLVLKTAKIVVFVYGGSDMTKDEALKVSANMLNKLYHSDKILPLVGILTLSDKVVLMIGWLCWGIDIIIQKSK